MKFNNLILAIILIIAFVSCNKDEGKKNYEFSIAGYAQKGQLIKGSSITAYALNNKLIATGESFPSTIKNDLGTFEITAEVSAPYLELKAEGYYFVENLGKTSEAPIYLNALVSSSQKDVNINLLTTITSARIKKLITDGKSFEEAKKQAEKEAFKAFSMQTDNIEFGFEQMNISKNGRENAILLALSCLIQEGRSAGDIQNIISDISSEFEKSATLPISLKDNIFNESQNVSIFPIVRNLLTFYNEKGIDNFDIPPFYAILNKEYASGFHIVETEINSIGGKYDTDIDGGIKEFNAISYENFIAESDVDWISSEIIEICSNLYALKIKIAPNPDASGRTGYLYIKSKSGDILYTNKTSQRGDGQRIYIDTPDNGTKSQNFSNGNIVNINGKDYTLSYDSDFKKYYIDLPKLSTGYGISNMPEMLVSAKNGDVLCATFTYKSEVQEFIIDNQDVSTRALQLTTIDNANVAKVPCYAALKASSGFELPNPADVKLQTACSILSFQFNYKESSDTPKFSELKVELGTDGFLSGEVTTCMYPDHSLYDPTYTTPKNIYKNKSNTVNITNTNDDNKISFLVHPQYIKTIKCTAYDSAGKEVFVIEGTINIELKKGTNVTYKISITK